MVIISSQRYLNCEIVDQKADALADADSITLEVWDVGKYGCAILHNGHHRLAAARKLGIPVHFMLAEHPKGITGDELLQRAKTDDDWYDVATGELFEL